MNRSRAALFALAITPVLLHSAISYGSDRALALSLIAVAGAHGLVHCSGLRGRLSFLAVALGIVAVLFSSGLLRISLVAIPLAIFLSLFTLFGRTLLRGHQPLITAIAEYDLGYPTPEMRDYTRKLTGIWTAFFGLCFIVTVALATLAAPEIWSAFANLGAYFFVPALLYGEYFYRRKRFPAMRHQSPLSLFKRLLSDDMSLRRFSACAVSR